MMIFSIEKLLFPVLFGWIAVTKYCRLSGLNNKTLFSHSFGGWTPVITLLVWLGSGEGPARGLQVASFLLCPHLETDLWCLFLFL